MTVTETPTTPVRINADTRPDWLPYVAPMIAFLVLTTLEGQLPLANEKTHPTYYPIAYGVKLIIVVIVTWFSREAWVDLRRLPCPKELAVAVLLGLLVTFQWVGLEGWYPTVSLLGSRSGFDPGVYSPIGKVGYLLMRFTGLVILVPVIEELFWRSFLWRWLIDPDFKKIAIGQPSTLAAAATAGLFALSHPEWLPALITGLLWAWLVWKTKSISACVISHAVANLALGLYVVSTGDWKYL